MTKKKGLQCLFFHSNNRIYNTKYIFLGNCCTFNFSVWKITQFRVFYKRTADHLQFKTGRIFPSGIDSWFVKLFPHLLYVQLSMTCIEKPNKREKAVINALFLSLYVTCSTIKRHSTNTQKPFYSPWRVLGCENSCTVSWLILRTSLCYTDSDHSLFNLSPNLTGVQHEIAGVLL